MNKSTSDMSNSTDGHTDSHLALPLISVAICTYNRADRLKLALDGLCQQSLPYSSFEILVIDNRSTDNTPEVCSQYKSLLPNLRYLYEPVQGLSKARNTAMQEAHCEYIAYLDDDAIPGKIWLESILHAFQTVQPTPVGIGGPIIPLWEIDTPDWMHAEMDYLFSIFDCGDQPHWLKFPQFPYGANMAYQRQALLQVGGFCEHLGRKENSLLSCEEHLLNKALARQGGKFYYVPQASVQHWIPKQRISLDWLVRRSHWQGRSEAVVDRLVGKSINRQRWESLSKVFNLTRLMASMSSESGLRAAGKLWRSRRWGYFYQVWFQQSLAREISDQLQSSPFATAQAITTKQTI